MRFTRRDFLTYSGIALSSAAMGFPFEALADTADQRAPRLIVGTDKKICSINLKTCEETAIEVSLKAHSYLQHPRDPDRFWTIEKWKRMAAEVDFKTNSVLHFLESPENTLFAGHGFLSPDGDILYAAIGDYNTGKGYLLAYDTHTRKLISREQITPGGLHDCHIQPDGTLLVASAGLKFARNPSQKDLLRVELSALLRVNLQTQSVIERHSILDDDQALGHFTMTKQGAIIAISTPTGEDKTPSGNIYFLETGGKDLRKVALPDELNHALKGEILSVAIDEANHVAAITNPHGNTLILIDSEKGKYIRHITEAYCSNASYDPIRKKFIVGGKNIVAVDGSDFSLKPFEVSHMHAPRADGKRKGMLYNGSHSIVV